MIKFTKPMQPCNADLDKIKFPCLVQKKWDGMKLIIRCDERGNLEFLGRSMKLIKNQWVVDQLTAVLSPFLGMKTFIFEGELQAGGLFENCDGLLSAKYRKFEDLKYHVFDEISDPNLTYDDRQSHVHAASVVIADPIFQYVTSAVCHNMDQLVHLHGFNDSDPALDGTIVRQADMSYKGGKRTTNEGYVVKIKDFHDDECLVVGFEEMMFNKNEKTTNPLGRSERSTHKAGMIPGNTLGSLVCRYEGGDEPVEVKLGTGFSAELRQKIWDNRDDVIGSSAKFKYMRITKYGVPLHPVFLGFRSSIDMD